MRIQIRPILFRIVLPFCLVLLCGFALVLWQYTRNSGSVRTTIVHLTNQGFEPARIEVKLGETVVFINNSSRKFWPASDLHPTHSIYPEFDAHAAIDPGGRWSFTFSKIGTWRYHDHLAPAARGVVVVHSDGGAGGEPLATNCSAIGTTADKESCWNEAVITLLDSQGVSAALEYVGKLYTTEPSFAADCHDYLHKVGEAVYDRRMDLSGLLGPETSYCGYGFFHGYMERLLAVSGDITEAAKFCDAVSQQATDTVRDACLHGFGHGLFASAAEKSTSAGNAEKMVETALAGCERMAGGQTERAARCSSGVFMELGVDEGGALYNLRIDTQQPLGICNRQPPVYMADCYRQMQVVVMNLAAGDVLKGARYSETLEDIDIAATSIETYMGGATRLDAAGVARALDACKHVKKELQQSCINGIALAYMLRGEPGREAEEAIKFCAGPGLSIGEAMDCRMYVIRYARSAYAPTILKKVCGMLPSVEQAQCK